MKRIPSWILWICLPLFNTLNQALMKLTAGVMHTQAFGLEWLREALFVPYLWVSLGCETINFVVWLAILKRHSLSRAFPMTSISYAALLATSWFYFHEKMMLQQIIGVAIIMTGIALLPQEEKA